MVDIFLRSQYVNKYITLLFSLFYGDGDDADGLQV